MGTAPAARRGLRTKTGCLTCRRRRKKCDERYPNCTLCHQSTRHCEWPSATDLIDRRHASHKGSRRRSPWPAPASETKSPTVEPDPDADVGCPDTICLRSESTSRKEVAYGLEDVLLRYFVHKYYDLLLLPNCHPEFRLGWIGEIKQLVADHKSLHYSVLANAASHLHFVDHSSPMHELALTYYSYALRGLSNILSQSFPLENHDGLLMSVMMLYVHGCMGKGTYSDIPQHVCATSRILALRLLNNPQPIARPFNRLAVESVLYQIFLITTGLWSDRIPLDYDFDAQFWLRAERLLLLSTLYPGASLSLNSPVLGVPVPLYRLAISLKQHYQAENPPDESALEALRTEVERWESTIMLGQQLDCLGPCETPNRQHQFYQDIAHLFIIIISVLFEQIVGQVTSTARYGKFPQHVSSWSWQLLRIRQILRHYDGDDDWARCFVTNWPIYTIGFFVSEPEDLELVRACLDRKWILTKFSQVVRFRGDLEAFWAEKGLASDRSRKVETLDDT